MVGGKTLLEVKNLKQYFPIRGGILGRTINHVKAVDDISFEVHQGETVSIVGESGCGKSTAGRSILRLEKPNNGNIIFDGVDLAKLQERAMRKKRGDIQIIFQDPYASLNPRRTVYQTIKEAMDIQNVGSKADRRRDIIKILETVGLGEHQMNHYPHQFSGGQRQRIGIARALSVRPKLIICDEAVSALDVSIQAQVLNLLKKLQKEYQLTYVFISHDLGVVRHISDRIIVMYLGKIMEIADKKALFNHPGHPYTYALLSSIPSTNMLEKKERIILHGDVPSPINPPKGCPFHTRCPFAIERCMYDLPPLHEVSEGQQVACHLAEEGIVDFVSLSREQEFSLTENQE
ncbi:MAG: dipeptide ABC transporter ATP-binding protein [Defluviitaleaceae bacterium]|nr:dipeptide ABC transporter ATP-binding protein [Defluviitaleaceae bacterium]